MTPLCSRLYPIVGLLLIVMAWLGAARLAAACSIDGIPSLTMNDRLVTVNYGQATKDNFAYWAAFSLGTTSAGHQVRLAEDLAKVRQALSAKAMTTPFSWSFSDGGAARGASVRHVFARPGWYKVNVSYYLPGKRQWVLFDSAQVDVLPIAGRTTEEAGADHMVWVSGGSLAIAIACGALLYGRARRRAHARTAPSNARRSPGNARGTRHKNTR